jgi:hypothetical protein
MVAKTSSSQVNSSPPPPSAQAPIGSSGSWTGPGEVDISINTDVVSSDAEDLLLVQPVAGVSASLSVKSDRVEVSSKDILKLQWLPCSGGSDVFTGTAKVNLDAFMAPSNKSFVDLAPVGVAFLLWDGDMATLDEYGGVVRAVLRLDCSSAG